MASTGDSILPWALETCCMHEKEREREREKERERDAAPKGKICLFHKATGMDFSLQLLQRTTLFQNVSACLGSVPHVSCGKLFMLFLRIWPNKSRLDRYLLLGPKL